MSSSVPPTLSISIVVYRSDLSLLRACLASVARAGHELSQAGLGRYVLDIVDNGPAEYSRELAAFLSNERTADAGGIRCLSGHGNVGYGAGNNLSIFDHDARYHLVLNPDTELQPDALRLAIDFMDTHLDVGMLAAASFSDDGAELRLCKSYPSVLVLAIRALGIEWLKRRFAHQLDEYEMAAWQSVGNDGRASRDINQGNDVTDGLISGSFMFCRTGPLKSVGGFDPAFFLYFEDFDLSRRLGGISRLVRLGSVRLIHHGGQAARKGLRHQWLFARGAWRFFNRYGWRLA